MATPPNANANPAQNAPAAGSTTLAGGGQNAPAPSGPTRKVKVLVVCTVPATQFHIHDLMVTVVDRGGNPVTESVRVAISGLSAARQVTATNGVYTETVSVPAGASGVVFRAVIPNGETDSKDLSAPAAPATPHHATPTERFGSLMSSYGWKTACGICALMSLAFFAGAFFGPYGLAWGESEWYKFALSIIFGIAAIALYYKAFGGHAPSSGGGH